MAYTNIQIEDIFKEIIERVEIGEPIRTVLKDDDMPSSRTFYKWLDEDEEKVKQYARACEVRADVIFEEILTIADKQGEDIIILDGKEVTNHNVVSRNRLQVDARKWVLSKMQPKKYGDKIDHTTDGEKIQTNVINLGEGSKD
jgi:hypothetical protein